MTKSARLILGVIDDFENLVTEKGTRYRIQQNSPFMPPTMLHSLHIN